MIKVLILILAIFTQVMAENITYSGIAHYEKNSFFGKKERSYVMTINFLKDKIFLSLNEYDCKTELIPQSQNSNVYTYSEKHISGSCTIDKKASTQIRIKENEIDYLWQSENELISALLLRK